MMLLGYRCKIFETGICGMFLEYCGNITSKLLEFAKRSAFSIIKSYTFNTKTTFPSRTFQKIFLFKMFPRCSPDVPDIATLGEHPENIPGILLADLPVTVFLLCIYTMLISLSHTNIFLETKAGVLHSIA